ncbi:Autophagy-related protein 9 [Dissostichus eleginoides]|uniref:Autophagy-related protein 9 n=1 Tax=Dissostichus eleginoides TaxID=100907 RepID=A0AAD9C8R7_DISEL|nr:Autophagy-related protein 9 [Dissostichus eleginoides]
MAAARVHREAQCLTSFSKIVLLYLIILCVFARFSWANYSYSRQSLLDINHRCINIVLDYQFNFGELPPELVKPPESRGEIHPTGSSRRRRRDRKQRRGKRGGLRAKLRLNPNRPALPSIFLANVRSLANKLDELKIWTLTQRRLMDRSLMFFSETWLSSIVPNGVVDLQGRTVFRADRVAAAR